MRMSVNNLLLPKFRKGDTFYMLFIFISLVLFFIATVYPIVFVLSASFTDPKIVASGKLLLLPVEPTLEGYKRILAYEDIWTGYANTIYYTVLGTLLNLVATLPCAYALSRRDLKGRNIIMVLFVITMYFSGGLIPGYLNVRSFGLVNTRTVMLINGLVSAYNLIVSRTFFTTNIPEEMQEAARIDGCSDFMTFWRIVLPLSKPIIVVMTLYYGVGRWNEYFAAMIYLRDREYFPLQLFLREILIQSKMMATQMFNTTDPKEIAEMMRLHDIANILKYGIIVVSTVPMLIIYPWLQKYFARGIMIGSLKG
jgi:putative aldouronate transport system permease protein